MNKNLNKIALTGLSVDKKHEDIIKSIVDILLKEEKNIFIEDNLVNSFDSLREYRSSPDQIEKNCDLMIYNKINNFNKVFNSDYNKISIISKKKTTTYKKMTKTNCAKKIINAISIL